jgi:hypothetical protein
MKVKDNIFGSRPERKLYKALEGSWPAKLKIYPGLPFLSVIDWSGARITQTERDFLKKTSLDYTACDAENDHPLISVEFDGLGRGFSREGKYYEVVGGQDFPYRSANLNLKLRLATQAGYTLVVVSYDEATPISEDDALTVTHGIIGSYLSHRFTQEKLNEIGPTFDFTGLSEKERQELIDDAVIAAEVDAEFEWNPLVVKEAEASRRALDAGMTSWQEHSMTDPQIPYAGGDISLRESMIAFMKCDRLGARITAKGPDFQVEREVWLRNVDDAITTSAIAKLIAGWLAFKAFAAEALNRKQLA